MRADIDRTRILCYTGYIGNSFCEEDEYNEKDVNMYPNGDFSAEWNGF